MEDIARKVALRSLPPIYRGARCRNPGGIMLSSDAIDSKENPLREWGLREMGIAMSAPWKTVTLREIEAGSMYINQWEILTAVRLVEAIGSKRIPPYGWRTVVIRV